MSCCGDEEKLQNERSHRPDALCIIRRPTNEIEYRPRRTGGMIPIFSSCPTCPQTRPGQLHLSLRLFPNHPKTLIFRKLCVRNQKCLGAELQSLDESLCSSAFPAPNFGAALTGIPGTMRSSFEKSLPEKSHLRRCPTTWICPATRPRTCCSRSLPNSRSTPPPPRCETSCWIGNPARSVQTRSVPATPHPRDLASSLPTRPRNY